MTNKQFAETDKPFKTKCEKSGIVPTKRQAGKYRRKTGLIYKTFSFRTLASIMTVPPYVPTAERV